MSKFITAKLIPQLSIGSDLEIANAARRSFDTEHEVWQVADARLVAFLVREGHWLPFRHPQLSFDCAVPVFVARQLGKHQVGMSWSEVSRRYKTEGIEFWEPEEWRGRPPENIKQGTGEPLSMGAQADASRIIQRVHTFTFWAYKRLLDLGVAPEQARSVLPQSMIVKYTWTGSLLAWLHLIKERNHPNAQQETTQFAELIMEEVAERFPVTWAAIVNKIPQDLPHAA
jgi:thymidylate synthase (FAD)